MATNARKTSRTAKKSTGRAPKREDAQGNVKSKTTSRAAKKSARSDVSGHAKFKHPTTRTHFK